VKTRPAGRCDSARTCPEKWHRVSPNSLDLPIPGRLDPVLDAWAPPPGRSPAEVPAHPISGRDRRVNRGGRVAPDSEPRDGESVNGPKRSDRRDANGGIDRVIEAHQDEPSPKTRRSGNGCTSEWRVPHAATSRKGRRERVKAPSTTKSRRRRRTRAGSGKRDSKTRRNLGQRVHRAGCASRPEE